MKTNLFLIISFCSFFSLELSAQQDAIVNLQEMPRFPGCEQVTDTEQRKMCSESALINFIATHIRYPQEAVEKGIEGLVIVNFMVEKDGSLSNIKVVREIGGGCGAEALRIVNLMNEQDIKWTPGKMDDEIVKVEFNLPVQYQFDTRKDRRQRRKNRNG